VTRRQATYAFIGFLTIVTVVLLFQQSGTSRRFNRTGPLDAGDVQCVDASYDGDPSDPADYSWNLHLIAATKNEFGKCWFTKNPGTPSAKQQEISLPKRMAAFEEAVRQWHREDLNYETPNSRKQIRTVFISSGMYQMKYIAYDRQTDNLNRQDNDLRDLIWGCIDDLRKRAPLGAEGDRQPTLGR
jgi:hypothetical protein